MQDSSLTHVLARLALIKLEVGGGDLRVHTRRALNVAEERWPASGALVMDEHIGHLQGVVSSSQGADGYLYVATWGAGCESTIEDPTGDLYRVVLDAP